MLGLEIMEWRSLARRQSLPLHLILFVTDRCNARCGTCFYWQNLNQGESLEPGHVEKLSRSLERLVWLDISGGEPFLRKDLAWIVHQFVDRNGARLINIPTNAIQTDVIARIDALRGKGPGRHDTVAAALALAGIGPDRTRLEIWADPTVTLTPSLADEMGGGEEVWACSKRGSTGSKRRCRGLGIAPLLALKMPALLCSIRVASARRQKSGSSASSVSVSLLGKSR